MAQVTHIERGSRKTLRIWGPATRNKPTRITIWRPADMGGSIELFLYSDGSIRLMDPPGPDGYVAERRDVDVRALGFMPMPGAPKRVGVTDIHVGPARPGLR